jgi:hypothetical protein
MAWRLAKSLETLRTQINTRYPKRSKISDGTIGDTRHKANKSDHNVNAKGVVTAFDITRDPHDGPDLTKLIPLFLKDKRTKYIIFDRKIYNPSLQGGKARPYKGSNAHEKHLHLSVSTDSEMYDRTFPWAFHEELTVAPYDPKRAVKFFEGRGWSKHAACALVASIMWESGGNSKNTIIWDAKGDKKDGEYKSRYSAQWNGPRIDKFETFARSIKRNVLDPYAQLAFMEYELGTTERKAANALRKATTIEEANDAAITFWRPSIPHKDKRLAIARKLMA